jgi:hypothetical protein
MNLYIDEDKISTDDIVGYSIANCIIGKRLFFFDKWGWKVKIVLKNGRPLEIIFNYFPDTLCKLLQNRSRRDK